MFDKIFDTRFASAVKYPAEEVQAWPRPVHIPFFQFDLHPVNLCTNYHYPTDIHDEALTVAAEHARMNLIAVIPEEETVILPDGESIGIKINKKETQSRD